MRTSLLAGAVALTLFAQGLAETPEKLYPGAWNEVTRRPSEKNQFSSADKAELETFRQWYQSTGRAIALKCRAGEPLTPNEAPFELLSRAGYMYEAFENGNVKRDLVAVGDAGTYVKETLEQIEEIMRKGYSGQTLTKEDLLRLSDYRLYTAMKRTQAHVLPYEFNLTSATVRNGTDAPDFCLPTLETILQSPAYTDENPQDRAAFLKPEGIEKFTRLFPGYCEENGRITEKPADCPKDCVQLSSFEGKKPVLFIIGNASDVFMRHCLPTLEPLVQAYQDRIQFFLIDITYHDTFSSGIEFYGDKAGQGIYHLWSSVPEERARIAKLQYMRSPNATLPCLIDDVYQSTRNKYTANGGDAAYVLIGTDGKIAAQAPSGWNYWNGGNYTDTVLWLNEIERAIVSVLNGEAPETPPPGRARKTERAPFAGRIAKNYGGEIKNVIWFSGTVTAVDPEKQTVAVKAAQLDPDAMKGWKFIQQDKGRIKIHPEVQQNLDTLEKWIQSGENEKIYTFDIGPGVELFVNGKEAEPADIKTGDRVGVKFRPADEGNALIKPEILRASR